MATTAAASDGGRGHDEGRRGNDAEKPVFPLIWVECVGIGSCACPNCKYGRHTIRFKAVTTRSEAKQRFEEALMLAKANNEGYLHKMFREEDNINADAVELIRKFIQKEEYAEDVIVFARNHYKKVIGNDEPPVTSHRGLQTAALLSQIWKIFYGLMDDPDDYSSISIDIQEGGD